MFQVTVPLPTKPIEEFQFDPRAVFSSDVSVYFNIDQILTVSVYCAIRTGAIPDVDMEMPTTVLKRVYKLLRDWKVIDKKKGNRSLEIIQTFIRHQTIIRAITATYHVPGGPLYKKEYDPAQVHLVGPRLFPTLEIVFAVLHLMASEIIDEEVPIVWKALCKMAGYDMKRTALENYQVERASMFKQELNYTHGFQNRRGGGPPNVEGPQAQNDADRYKINLNFLSFKGTLPAIAMRLQEHCQPALSDAQILDVLKSMCNRQLHAKDGKIYRTVEQSVLDSYVSGHGTQNEQGRARTDEEFKAWITRDEKYIVVCEYNENSKHLFVAPEILEVFDLNVLDRAFYLSTMCSSFPRIHAIRGVVYDDHPDLFEVVPWTDKFVNDYVAAIDAINGNALKRSEGCAVPTRERMTETEQDMLLSVQLNPARKNHEEDYYKVLEARSLDYRKITDWDLYAAKRAAFRCGIPLTRDTVFWTDPEIYRAYVKYCSENEMEHSLPSGTCNYPHSIIAERKRVEDKIDPIHQQMKGTAELRAQVPQATPSRARNLVIPSARRTTRDRLVRLASRDTEATVSPGNGATRTTHTPERNNNRARFQSVLEQALEED